MFSGYEWSFMDVLGLLNIHYNPGKEEQEIYCPFCGGKRFGVNLKKGTGHCWHCGEAADSAGYYAASTGMTKRDARKDIVNRLHLSTASGELPKRIVFKEAPQAIMAPIEVRDKTYRAFLGELYLNQKDTDNLLARGFSPEDIESLGYKTYPAPDGRHFQDICHRLLNQGCVLEGVPGFFLDSNNEACIPRITQGIIIPQIDCHNMIAGLQIRKDDDLRREFDGELEAKCSWFSSKGKNHGTPAHVSVHTATDFKWNQETKQYDPMLHGNKVTLTEGGMKADLCNCLLDGKVSIIAVPGVQSYGALAKELSELKKFGLETVNLAFDMDYLTNPNVKDAMFKVQNVITKECGLKCDNIMNWQYEVKESGETFYLKGLDDYFAYLQKHIVPHAVHSEEK